MMLEVGSATGMGVWSHLWTRYTATGHVMMKSIQWRERSRTIGMKQAATSSGKTHWRKS